MRSLALIGVFVAKVGNVGFDFAGQMGRVRVHQGSAACPHWRLVV
jgi:hypothetical protein